MNGNAVLVQVVAADCSAILSALNRAQIRVQKVNRIDALTIRFQVQHANVQTTQIIVDRSGGKLKVLRSAATIKTVHSVCKRPVLIFGILLMAALTLYLPTKVLFVLVEGNTQVPERMILECAQSCGITFGASRREIRSERVKNQLLQTMPQLQWVGVNTYGCTAVISVKERETEEKEEAFPGVSSIVAVRDGIIESCTATKGNLVCKPGQAVKAGQTLISGYTDCGLSIRAERSEGEVFAQTLRSVKVVVPADWDKKGEVTSTRKNYSVIIGKKRINFYKDSGILDTTCDKMYTEYVLTLPGGFQLPVVLLVEELVCRNVQTTNAQVQDVSNVARETARNYLLGQMISGSILTHELIDEADDDVYVLTGEYRCSEMIGRMRSEEIIQSNGENN